MEKNLTSGSVLKNLVYFSLPYLLSYFLQTLYGMADLFIIGQFEGVAGTTAWSLSEASHAYADCDDCGPCHGRYREHWPGRRGQGQEKSGRLHGKYSYGLSGALCDSDGGAASFPCEVSFQSCQPRRKLWRERFVI